MDRAAAPEPFVPPPLPSPPPPRPPGSSIGEVLGGFAFGLFVPIALAFTLGNIVFSGPSTLPDQFAFFVVFGTGIWQALWVVPMSIALWKRGKKSFVQGLLMGSSVSFLLSAACFGLILSFRGY